MKGFQSFPALCKKNCGGGLYILIRHGVCDSGRNAEFIMVRLSCWDRGLPLILAYGLQDYDSKENRDDLYNSFSVEIEWWSFFAGDDLFLPVLAMPNSFKSSRVFPQSWREICIKTPNKRTGSFKYLKNYRGTFIIPIISIMVEKLLKNTITLILKQNISNFQDCGSKGKGMASNSSITQRV